VLVHRPGTEFERITPRTAGRLRFDRVPWLAKAQQEHDALTNELRSRGVDVVLMTELLHDVLEQSGARDEVIGSVIDGAGLGRELGFAVREHLESLAPQDLAAALMAGLAPSDLRAGRGLVYELLSPHDFVIEPLPGMVFCRDSSVCIGDQVVITGLARPRARENVLLAAVYRYHPRFTGLNAPFLAAPDRIDGGDVLLLAPGVVAVGVGTRTTPTSVERLARHLFDAGAAAEILAVPMSQARRGGYLDLACTVLDPGTVLMAPALAFTLTALALTMRGGAVVVSRSRPFLDAAARAIGVDKLTVVDTGQRDDGANVLVIGQGVVICDERNVETNAGLAAAGYDVVTVPAGELGGLGARAGRRGPRSMCAPLERDPAQARGLLLAEIGTAVVPSG
jgi:arginine deiminase